MKIGIDARFLGTETGIGRYVLELVKHLEEAEGEKEFVIFLRKENWDIWQPKNPRFKKVLADIPWYGLKEQLEMPKIIARENIDLMHFPHFNIPFLYKKPFIATIHDLILLKYPSARASTLGPLKFYIKYLFYRLVLQRAIRESRKIIAASEFVKQDILKNFSVLPEKIKVTYVGVPSAFKNTHDRDCPRRDYFLYVGNAYPHKNLEGLMKAFEIFNKNKNYNLILIGKEDYFKKRLKREFENKNIIFKDFVSDEELSEFYAGAAAYVFPSFSEGFGVPGIEAMAHGVPVLASNSSCLPEIYGDAALYFDPKNINQMAERMEEIAKDENLREELIKKGFEQIKKYSWKKCAEETAEIYNEIS